MDSYWKNKSVLVTGAGGFLGSHLRIFLEKNLPKNVSTPKSSELDLRKLENCRKAVENIDIVIHLAGNVGGIGYNQEYPGTLFYDNLIMGAQLMEQARLAKVSKFVAIGTICAYPKFTKAPFKEEDLWAGYPEETNAPYGLAKKMLLVQAQAYRQQYDFNAIYLLPTNLYGPGDNFDPEKSHVIPALIKKFIDAKNTQKDIVTIWGSGNPSRDFLYVKDAAEAIIMAVEKYNDSEPINIGTGIEIKIRDLAELIASLVGYRGRIIYDSSMPDGQPIRSVSSTRAKKEFGFQAKTSLENGLKETIDWYMNHF